MKDIIRKTKDFLLLVLPIAFLLTSCETLVNNVPPGRLPSLEEKLVISSFISPQDTLVKVYVSLSSPLFSEAKSVFRSFQVINGDTTFFGETPFISDADVFLKSGDTEVKLKYNSQEEFYFMIPSASTLEILPNRKYELRVNFEGKSSTSETIVPELQILSFEAKIDTNSRSGEQFFGNGLSVESEVSLVTEVGGYYRIRGYAEGVGVFLNFSGNNNLELFLADQSSTLFYDNDGIIDAFKVTKSTIFKKRGTAFFSSPNYSINGQAVVFEEKPKVNSVYNEVMRITEPYYLYYESIRNYNSDNPFTEPTPIYSNIKGGLGIFASSNRIGKRVEFK